MAQVPIDGALIQGAAGEFYFISNKDLQMYRLSAKEAKRTQELIGPKGLGKVNTKPSAGRVAVLPALFGPIGTVVNNLADDPTVSKVLRDDPTVSKFLRDDPTVSKVLRDDPTVSKKLKDDPTVSKISRGLTRSRAASAAKKVPKQA